MFSVVIPLWNKGPYVQRAVASALAQTTPATEIIVVDDGSTDGGAEAVGAMFPTVRVIRQVNGGEGSARNTGVRMAQSSWVAFLDADDFWLPFHLSELGRIIDGCPEARLVATATTSWRDGETPPPSKGAKRPSYIDYFRVAARDISVITASSAAISRETFLAIGGFGTEPRGADLAFWAKVALQAPVAVTHTTTCVYVRGVGGVMESDANRLASIRGGAEQTFTTPSIEVVLNAARQPTNRDLTRDLHEYLDSRRLAAMRQYLASGSLHDARQLRGELSLSRSRLLNWVSLLTLVPTPILGAGLRLRTATRGRDTSGRSHAA